MGKPSIFMSHSSPDKPFVRWLTGFLQNRGARIWLDEAEIKIGESLIDKISDGLKECDYIAAIISKTSVQSEWVKRELNIAITQEINGKFIKVLPIVIESCSIPLFLLDKKYIDFSTDNLHRLDQARSLVADLGMDEGDNQLMFFRNFIAYDCFNENSGFDVNLIDHFRPSEMEKILRRIWFFGAKIHGMDIANDFGEGAGIRGHRWGIVGADWPTGEGSEKLGTWIDFVRQECFQDCLFSPSYSIPDEVISTFL